MNIQWSISGLILICTSFLFWIAIYQNSTFISNKLHKLVIENQKASSHKEIDKGWINHSKTFDVAKASVTDVAIIPAHPPMGSTIRNIIQKIWNVWGFFQYSTVLTLVFPYVSYLFSTVYLTIFAIKSQLRNSCDEKLHLNNFYTNHVT